MTKHHPARPASVYRRSTFHEIWTQWQKVFVKRTVMLINADAPLAAMVKELGKRK